MQLTKVIVKTTSYGSDFVSDILISNGSLGTTFIDKENTKKFLSEQNQNLNKQEIEKIVQSYPDYVLVVGTVEKKSDVDNITKDLSVLAKNATDNVGELVVRTEQISDDHWTDIWTDFFKPFTIGNIKIYSTLHKQSLDLFKTKIILKPGPAFGTGQHPTTLSCIKFLQKLNLKNKCVFDIGCGSGILGIVALKSGAKEVLFTDIDNSAILDTNTNLKLNKLNAKVLKEDIIGNPNYKTDILVCNISTEVCLSFVDKISQNLNNKAFLILSGIIDENTQIVTNAYSKKGFNMIEKVSLDGWTTILLEKVNA